MRIQFGVFTLLSLFSSQLALARMGDVTIIPGDSEEECVAQATKQALSDTRYHALKFGQFSNIGTIGFFDEKRFVAIGEMPDGQTIKVIAVSKPTTELSAHGSSTRCVLSESSLLTRSKGYGFIARTFPGLDDQFGPKGLLTYQQLQYTPEVDPRIATGSFKSGVYPHEEVSWGASQSREAGSAR